jgi:hypothetical protein
VDTTGNHQNPETNMIAFLERPSLANEYADLREQMGEINSRPVYSPAVAVHACVATRLHIAVKRIQTVG